MHFQKLATVNVLSALVYVAVVLSLAWTEHGVMSMAWASVVAAVFEFALWQCLIGREFPRLPAFRGLGAVMSFGGFACGAGLMRGLSLRGPELVIGKILDLAAVGLFSRAFWLILIFHRIIVAGIRPVVLPHLAGVRRRGEDAKAAYLRLLTYSTGIAWPFFVFLALFAQPIVRLLFGDQWDDSVPVGQVLCVLGATEALFYFGSEMLVAIGQVRGAFYTNVIIAPFKIVCVALGAWFGLVPAAAAVGIVGFVEFGITHRMIRRHVPIGFSDYVKALAPSFQTAGWAGLAPLLVFLGTSGEGVFAYLWMAVAAGAAGAGWVAGLWSSAHPLRDELRRFFPKIQALFV